MVIKTRSERKTRRRDEPQQQVVFPGAGASIFGGQTGLAPADETKAIDALLGRHRRRIAAS